METDLATVLPELEDIGNDDLRSKVKRSFEIGLEEGEFTSISDIPWAPHHMATVGNQGFVHHVRDVAALSTSIGDRLSARRSIDLDEDHLLAGALVHDISKFFEHEDGAHSEVREYLGHPNFCIYVLEKADLPTHIQHIALSHTPQSSVEPKTIEAAVVRHADALAMDAIFLEATGNIKLASK